MARFYRYSETAQEQLGCTEWMHILDGAGRGYAWICADEAIDIIESEVTGLLEFSLLKNRGLPPPPYTQADLLQIMLQASDLTD